MTLRRVPRRLRRRSSPGPATTSSPPPTSQGTTISLTNPGGIGTVHSVPRLMKGQGCIIGAGALEYPAEFQGSSAKTLAELGIGKTITLTSTYDHRVIQGAGSGEFLKIVHELLIGERDFYEDIFAALRIPYDPIHWAPDISVDLAERRRQDRPRAGAHQLVPRARPPDGRHRPARVRAALAPRPRHREPRPHLLGPRPRVRHRRVRRHARRRCCATSSACCATRTAAPIGIEYMHIQDPAQRELDPGPASSARTRSRRTTSSCASSASSTRPRRSRPSCRPSTSARSASASRAASRPSRCSTPILQGAAEAGLDEVAIGMAHRGRLNVLTNIAGKTYGQIFREFEGTQDPRTVQGSGDVKYHLGTEGTFTRRRRRGDPGLPRREPVAPRGRRRRARGHRARQAGPHARSARSSTLPILIHGDAAMAGQGVVVETLQMSQLRGYRTGGTIHVIINNQVGFTTPPGEAPHARSTRPTSPRRSRRRSST